jgi:hypothetical protein
VICQRTQLKTGAIWRIAVARLILTADDVTTTLTNGCAEAQPPLATVPSVKDDLRVIPATSETRSATRDNAVSVLRTPSLCAQVAAGCATGTRNVVRLRRRHRTT